MRDEAFAIVTDHLVAAFWRSFVSNRGAALGLGLVVMIVAAALLADFIAPHSPYRQYRDFVLIPPSWQMGGDSAFLLGTDDLGRDLLSRMLHGARNSLATSFCVVTVSLTIGIALGLISAFSRGLVGSFIERFQDLIMSVPSLVLAIVIVAIIGPSQVNTIIAIAIVFLPRYARVVRTAAAAEKVKDYVLAARVIGAGPLRLALTTVLPNCLPPVIVQATLGISDAILESAALGFLGLGAQPPTPEWGAMLAAGRDYLQRAPWVVTFPGLAILVTVIAVNLLGDGLRDALDLKQRRS